MKASHLALVTLVLGLGLGFAAGAVFSSNPVSAGAPATLMADPSDSGTSDRGSVDEGASLPSVGARPTTSSASITSSASSASPEAKRIARESIQVAGRSGAAGDGEDPSEWTHSIQGTVIDQDGQPMPGVQIVSMNRLGQAWRGVMKGTQTAKIGRAWEGIPDVEESIAKSAESMLENERNHRTAMSDSMGRFTLTGLREGLHAVSAHADGFAFARQTNHTGQECSFIGERVLELELDVRLPDGSQPESAVVFTGEQRYGKEIAWTPEEPRLRLKDAAFEITVRSGSVQRLDWRNIASDYSSEPRPMNLETEGPGPHVIQLAMNQILRVELEDSSELVPKLPVWMKVTSAAATQAARSDEIDWSAEHHSELTRGASGLFQVADLPKGAYWIAAGRGEGNYDPEVIAKITTGLGVTEEKISLDEVDLSQFVVCRCARSEGGPVADVSFQVTSPGERFSRARDIDAVKRGRGEYWLPKDSLFPKESTDASASAGQPELAAKSEVDGQVMVPLEPGADEISIEFLPGCTLHLDIAGDLSAGLSAHVNRLDASGEPTERYITMMTGGIKKIPDDGQLSMMALQPGKYEVNVYETGHGAESFGFKARGDRVMSENIEIIRPETDLRIVVPSMHKVQVHAPNVGAGETFRLSQGDKAVFSTGHRAKLDNDGIATFERVPAGEYVLSGPERKKPMNISVPTGEIQWVTEVIDSARVRSVEAGGAADQAGLRRGDIVIAVDGSPVKGKVRSSTIAKSANQQSVRLTVLRNKESMDVTIGPLGMVDGKPSPIGFSLSTHTLGPDDR